MFLCLTRHDKIRLSQKRRHLRNIYCIDRKTDMKTIAKIKNIQINVK